MAKMFCYQCQEAAGNRGCSARGMCGKTAETANLQDLLVHVLKGVAVYGAKAADEGVLDRASGFFMADALFTTITNANFDNARMTVLVDEALQLRAALCAKVGAQVTVPLPDAATWTPASAADYAAKAEQVGVLSQPNEDVRSLHELLIYGLKGVAAYAHHAAVLGFEQDAVYGDIMRRLASTTRDLPVDQMIAEVMQTGALAVTVMALLDQANTSTFGQPEITTVNLGVRQNPGILVSGHDLKDLHELLEQTAGTGVDVYTHSEMLPAHYYPTFKRYPHFVGNYGNAWWKQDEEFESFNGPILMTTNCIVPVRDSYKARIYTTGSAGYPGVKHIADRPKGGQKNFAALVTQAKGCPAPISLETGTLVGGFAHNQVMALAGKVVEAVKSGAIKRFVVMAGCDGRQKGRAYFTEVAETLPKDAVILTAGCAKYRYNKLNLGDIGGIPRVLDAGQCNDSYSLVVIALKLKEAFGLQSLNDLPLSFDIAWYEQKAVCVLLALLHLGVKGIRLGPTLPAFLSPNVAKVLVENFGIKATGEAGADVAAIMAGQ